MKPATNPPTRGTVATRLAALQQRIAVAHAHAPVRGRPPTVVGASKTQPAAILQEAIRAGLMEFGENRVQEAQKKWPALKAAYPQTVLHLIGPLQSNKAGDAVALFDVIETVDREKIADALAGECRRQGKSPVCLIQVNTGEEPQKGGVAPAALDALVQHCRAVGLNLQGLMCIPPADANPAPHFALLKKLAARYALPLVSMGMSGDFELATRFGATHVRIGTALFGEREA